MSIRIHELAKRLNMDGKDLLALLKERGYVSADTKSVSSTLSKIYEEEIDKEFAPKLAAAAAPAAPAPGVDAPAPAAGPGAAPQVKLPPGVFVKSKDDITREREEQAKAKAAAATPVSAPPSPPVLPARPIAPQPMPPRPVSAPTIPQKPASSMPTPAYAARPAPLAPPPAGRTFSAPAPLPPLVAAKAPTPPPAPPTMAQQMTASVPKPPPAIASAPSTPVLPPTTAPSIVVIQQGDVKVVQMKPPVIVRDFAVALGLKPFKLISELMEMGIFSSMNATIDEAVAVKVAEKHGVMLEVKHRGDAATVQAAKEKQKADKDKPVEDESKFLELRPPVVCILGHVDHGKTSLLDAIRKADVAAGEAGGITQHIGAYQIEFNGRKITFLDTPGHAAFSKMRARGADVTDVAVLVVAADDGFMPQTDEALKHAQNADVTLLVAVNKMDVKGANIDQVKSQMQQRNIAPEDWGGETVTVPVSAIKGTGINELLEMILLQADVLELKANPKAEGSGVIIESEVEVGRGALATVIVQRGTLRVGDAIVCGEQWAKIRAMYDDQGKNIKEAPPSTPARVIGWSGPPDSGASFRVVKNAREAEGLAEEEQQRTKKQANTVAAVPRNVSVEQLFADIAATQHKVLKVIIKSDVFGSIEAVRSILEGIKSTKVSLEVVATDVGLVTKNDVLMASAAGSVILGFNTKLENGVTPLAKHHGVRIENYSIIYELGDDPDLKEVKLGAAEVRATFPLAKGFVAGCLVTEGKITRNATARLRRGKQNVHEGKVQTLKRFKDDANEVRAGLECGIKLDDFNGYETGDVIEVFEVQKVRAAL
jgi:translation initiation factor IF-2